MPTPSNPIVLPRLTQAELDALTPEDGWLAWNTDEAEIDQGLGGAFAPLPAGGSGVTSVNGDTGPAVLLDAGDIPFTPVGTISATDVQAAIAEVSSESAPASEPIAAAHIADTSAAHAASAIGFTPVGTIAATDAQAAIAEVATDAAGALATHEADTTNVHGIVDTSALALTANVILKALIDAKGDLIVGTAADTPGILTVGANDTILMADSGQATGLKWVASQTPSDQAVGDAAAQGTADTYARGDHKHGMPAFATNAVALGTAAAAGAAATLIRSDATIAAFDATAPSTQAFGDAAAVGAAAFAARRDHKHAFPSLGTGATDACAGDDARLSDDRTNPGSARTTAAAIANTETVIISYTCAANELAAGMTFHFKAWFSQAGANAATPTLRIRIGTTTLTGNIAATLTGTAGNAGTLGSIEGMFTVRTDGAGGTAIGGLRWFKGGQATIVATPTATVAVDTTAANQKVELTFISGSGTNTYTWTIASVAKVVA